ncbi:MAG: NAD-dependent epimerase/dehydratase family protein [Legionella sp.]
MPTICISGSQGLIGKTLGKYLNQHRYQINELDFLLPKNHVGFGDITQFEQVKQAIRDCDGIIHLAAVSRVIWGEQAPEQCWQTNVIGTKNILSAAYESARKPWVLYASSREVYGQQSYFPVTEEAPWQPINTYARSKVAAEELVNQFESLGLTTAILRFSSVYGRIDDYQDRVVPAFCKAAATGKVLRIDGLDNTFDFTHVQDVADGIHQAIRLLEQKKSLPTMHLTTGKGTTLLELAKLAISAGNSSSHFIEAPPRTFDVAQFYGDSSRAQQLLNWQPSIDIATGVQQLVADFIAQAQQEQ